jgi:hypothetical protein
MQDSTRQSESNSNLSSLGKFALESCVYIQEKNAFSESISYPLMPMIRSIQSLSEFRRWSVCLLLGGVFHYGLWRGPWDDLLSDAFRESILFLLAS